MQKTKKARQLTLLRHFKRQAILDDQLGYEPRLILTRLKQNNAELPQSLRFKATTLTELRDLITDPDRDADSECNADAESRPRSTDDEVKPWVKMARAFWDSELPIPPRFKNVWGTLLFLAHHKKQRMVEKMSHRRLAPKCGKEDARIVAQAVRYLRWIVVMHILLKGGTKRGDTRYTTVYHVPPVSALDLDLVKRAIKLVPQHLTRLRPDLARTRRKGTTSS